MAVQPGLCRTLSETPKTDLLKTRLNHLASFSDCTAWFESDLVGDLTDRFSCDKAKILCENKNRFFP